MRNLFAAALLFLAVARPIDIAIPLDVPLAFVSMTRISN